MRYSDKGFALRQTEDAPQIAPLTRASTDNASVLSAADHAAEATLAQAVNTPRAARGPAHDPIIPPQPVQRATPPLLSFMGGVHWRCTDIAELIILLLQEDFRFVETKHPNEQARLWHVTHGTIVVKRNDWLSARGEAKAFLESLRKAVR